MRKLHVKRFVCLLLFLALLTGAVFGLHQLQAGNIADALLWQANQAEKDGNLGRAAKYLSRYLEFAHDDLDTREHLGMILADPQLATTPQRRARARFVVDQVLAKDPERHALRKRLCETLISGRSFEIAKEHLTYLEKSQPGSAAVACLLGQWHEGQGKSAAAIDAYRRALKLDDGYVDACVRLVALLKQADFGTAPTHAEEIDHLVVTALEKAPRDAAVLSLAAQHAQENGHTAIALTYLEDGLKQNPAEPRLYLALARVHAANGKRGLAIDKLRLGLDKIRKEQRYDLRWSLANLLLDDNRLDDAQKIVKDIRDANPASANYLEARAFMQRGRWFDAARQFEKIRPALKSTRELAFQIDLYLGACFEQLDEPMLQLTAYERAAQIDPTSLTARHGVAAARLALGQTAEALQIHRDLIALTKDPREAAQRRLEYARHFLQSGLAQGPKEWRKLSQELDEIAKILPRSLDVALLQAELYFVQGDKDKAVALLRSTVEAHPDRFEPWLSLLGVADTKESARLMQTAEERFHDKADFRLAQIRYWAQRYETDGEAALRRLEKDNDRFEPRDRSPMLQAIAEAHYNAGQYADSMRVLAQLIDLPMHAQDARIRMQMLEVALLQADDARARAILDDIKRLDGDKAGGVDWSLGEAMRLVFAARAGKKDGLAQARRLLTVAAAQRPNWHPILQLRAELDELEGRLDQAIANYQRALDLGSRDPRVAKQLLVLLAQAQRHDEVEQVLARMQKQQGTTDEVVRYYVAHSCNRRDFRKAEFLIKQIVAANSTNFRDHLWMGQILSSAGQASADAEKALRRAVALAPTQPEAWIGLVRHLISVGQNQKASAEIDNAKKALPPERVDTTLAQCYELMGLLRDAADSHTRAVEKQPTSVLARRAAADFCLRVNLLSEAESLYRKINDRALPAGEDDVRAARRGLALALVKQPRPDKKTEALALVGLTLDDQGRVPETKFAAAPEERLLQAKVLGSMGHYAQRGKAIALLESLQQKNALAADDQFFLVQLLIQQLPASANKGSDSADSALWIKARTLLRSITLAYPKNSRYLAFSAQQHIEQREFADAEPIIARLEAVERERQTTPGGFGSIELRAKLLELRGLGSQAVTLLTTYTEQPGAAPVRKLLLAELHGRLGNFQTAIDLCEEVRQTAALANLGHAAAVAILRANKPSAAQPTKLDHWQQQRVRVETSIRSAMQKDPRDIPPRMHLADLVELQGKYDEVEKLCRDVLKQDENHLVALNNLAWLLGQKSATAAEALVLIDRAIAQHGMRPELLDTRAVVQLNLGNLDQATRDLERVVREAPTPARLFHLCQTYERAKNIASAQAFLRQAHDMGLTAQTLHPVEQAEYQRVTTELGKRQ